MSKLNFDDEITSDNEEIIEDITPFDPSEIVVYSRDWTIETIFSQIKGGNIDLNPKYQRRNVWTDHKRSKLIESILIGYPVPEIVLAEDPKQKKSFSVIDGKQRLLTIAGFIAPDKYNYWDKPTLMDLSVKAKLNKHIYSELEGNPAFSDDFRQFMNASLRCTIITNFKENDVLYDIFYRLNSGSTPLATQELRQVLNRGEFANYLISTTNDLQPLHRIMRLEEPDKRLRDIEVLLRCFSMILFSKSYTGNLKAFLDNSMGIITKEWNKYEAEIQNLYAKINRTIEILKDIYGDYTMIGRKFTDGKPEKRFNRVLLEVQLFYFIHLDPSLRTAATIKSFMEKFIKLSQDDFEFRNSIEASTKNIENYRIRFTKFQKLINEAFGSKIDVNPFI
ncbi:MAG: DUF262 domain-containing protein [Bacteroidota bacterium]